MGKKITERATGQVWTVMGDTEGHTILGDEPPKERPKSYRIKNEATGEERLVGADISARFEGNF